MSTQEKTFVPGLAGVPATESSVSYIDGNVGVLEYRGYPIEALSERSRSARATRMRPNIAGTRVRPSNRIASSRALLIMMIPVIWISSPG